MRIKTLNEHVGWIIAELLDDGYFYYKNFYPTIMEDKLGMVVEGDEPCRMVLELQVYANHNKVIIRKMAKDTEGLFAKSPIGWNRYELEYLKPNFIISRVDWKWVSSHKKWIRIHNDVLGGLKFIKEMYGCNTWKEYFENRIMGKCGYCMVYKKGNSCDECPLYFKYCAGEYNPYSTFWRIYDEMSKVHPDISLVMLWIKEMVLAISNTLTAPEWSENLWVPSTQKIDDFV